MWRSVWETLEDSIWILPGVLSLAGILFLSWLVTYGVL